MELSRCCSKNLGAALTFTPSRLWWGSIMPCNIPCHGQSELLLFDSHGRIPILDLQYATSAPVGILSTFPSTASRFCGQDFQNVRNSTSAANCFLSDDLPGSRNPCMISFEVCGITREMKKNTSKTV
jgi:hypothetical protein